MAVQPILCQTLSETLKTGFLKRLSTNAVVKVRTAAGHFGDKDTQNALTTKCKMLIS